MAPSLRSLGNARLSMLNKPRQLATRPEFAADILREWGNAMEATVRVGRLLNQAKATLAHGEFEAMVESDLPFKAATARKLRKAAELVDSGEISLERLPEAYTLLYAIASMPDETRQQALDAGVIRPEVTRSELEAFKVPKPADPAIEPPAMARWEDVRVALTDLGFKSPPDPEEESEPVQTELEDAIRSAVPVVEAKPPAWLKEEPSPTVIDVEPVVVEEATAPLAVEPPAGVELPAPAITVHPQPPQPEVVEALQAPWKLSEPHGNGIVAQIGGEEWLLLALIPIRHMDAATILQHVVDLHNAALMANKTE